MSKPFLTPASCSSSSDISLLSLLFAGNWGIVTSTSGLFGTTGEVPGGTSSPMEFTGVPTGDRGESEETALGLFKNKTWSAKCSKSWQWIYRQVGQHCIYVYQDLSISQYRFSWPFFVFFVSSTVINKKFDSYCEYICRLWSFKFTSLSISWE